jgi:hypothetical protein
MSVRVVRISGAISGNSRQSVVANAHVSGFIGIVGTNVKRKHEYPSGDSRQPITFNKPLHISADINNG